MFKPREPRNIDEAWIFTCINLFATPGLGSILARRFVAGSIQVTIASTGFLLLMWWFIQKMRLLYGQIFGTDLPLDLGEVAGKWGLGLFVTAWIWSLITSIQLFRAVKETPMSIPPKIQ